VKALTISDPRAAFVDIGSWRMHVSVAGGEPAISGTVTAQLHALRDWRREVHRAESAVAGSNANAIG